jgi:hypothetical protein
MHVRRHVAVGLSLVLNTALVSWSAALLNAAPPASDFPYIAYVAEPDSYVRSGPGRDHYPTGQLPAGYAVEVHRHDGNSWCAIRPPEGSFSLAPVQQMQLVDQQTGTITGDGIVARVGSLLGDQRNAVQVMLERGESVAILEPPSPTSPWVRIAPPAGEFRWIAARRLSRTPPTEMKPLFPGSGGWQSPGTAAAASSIGRISPPEPSDDPAQTSGDQFAHLLTAPAQAASSAPSYAAVSPRNAAAPWTPQPAIVEPAPASAITASYNAHDIQVIAGSPAAVMQAQYQQPVPSTAPAGAIAAPPLMSTPAPTAMPDASAGIATGTTAGQPRVRFEGLSAPNSGPLDSRVAEMQVRLSQIVVGAPASWQFGGLRGEAAALLAQEQSPAVRDQLRDLMERIATFETVQSRYRGGSGAALAAASTPAGAASPGGAAANALATTDASEILNRVRNDLGRGADNGVTPTPGATPSATEALYDAVGTLKPVVSKRSGAPQFALIDDHGDVVTFVTSSPDVNLQAFVGKRIGVRGSRGFMPEYRRAHVTASRVTPLEQTMIK